MSAKGLRIEMKQKEHLWGRLFHHQQSGGPAPASLASLSCSSYLAQCWAARHATSVPPLLWAWWWQQLLGPSQDGRRHSEIWEVRPKSCSWLPGQTGDREQGHSSMLGTGTWPHDGEEKWWGCRGAQQGLRHGETGDKQMRKSSVLISDKRK